MLDCGSSSPPLLLPAAFCRLRNPLRPLLVSGCASATGQRGLTAMGGNYTRDKLSELCMQVVGQRKGCSRWETRLVSLACHSARCAWDMALCCIKQFCQLVSGTALRNWAAPLQKVSPCHQNCLGKELIPQIYTENSPLCLEQLLNL